MKKQIYFLSILALYYFSFNLFANKVVSLPNLQLQYKYDFDTKQSYKFATKIMSVPLVVDQLIANDKNDRYLVTKLNQQGDKSTSFLVPSSSKVTKTSGESLVLDGGRGYLTYPAHGGYFIWYPQLGSELYVFDDTGEFLWNKKESRYLAAFSHGKYIMGMAGDHSRVHFFKPNMQTVANVEGHLAIQYKTEKKYNSKRRFDACISFLGGDVAFVSIDSRIEKNGDQLKQVYRKNGIEPVKSIACNFENGDYLIQKQVSIKSDDNSSSETATELKDKLEFHNIIDQKKNKSTINLSQAYPFNLPMFYHFKAKYGSVILPVANTLELYTFTTDKLKPLIKLDLLFNQIESIEDLKAVKINKYIIYWHATGLIIINKNSVVHFKQIQDIEDVIVKKNNLFIITKNNVLSYNI